MRKNLSYLTLASLRQQGFDVRLADKDFKAHSGAKIGKERESRPPNPAARSGDPLAGEISDPYPTILEQLEATEDKLGVDLLVVNGLANDVGFLEAANPLYRTGKNIGLTVEKTTPEMADRVRVLLDKLEEFRNALIFYTGYYPGLSPWSDLPYLPEDWTSEEFPQLKRQVALFHREILRHLSEKIQEKTQAGHQAVFFVDPMFSERNAMLAPEDMVHGLGRPYNKTIARQRSALYMRHNPDVPQGVIDAYLENPLFIFEDETNEKLQTYYKVANAHIAHPNVRGAQQYARRLSETMAHQLSFSVRDQLGALGVGGSLRDAQNKFRVSGTRQLSTFRALACFAVHLEFDRETVLVENRWPDSWDDFIYGLETDAANHRLFKVGVDLGFGEHKMWMIDGPKQASGLIDYVPQRPITQIKYASVTFDGKRELPRNLTGRLKLYLNGYKIYENYRLTIADYRRENGGRFTLKVPYPFD